MNINAKAGRALYFLWNLKLKSQKLWYNISRHWYCCLEDPTFHLLFIFVSENSIILRKKKKQFKVWYQPYMSSILLFVVYHNIRRILLALFLSMHYYVSSVTACVLCSWKRNRLIWWFRYCLFLFSFLLSISLITSTPYC
jgi:hypothetical protein